VETEGSRVISLLKRLFPFEKGNRDTGYRLVDLLGFHIGTFQFRLILGRYPEGASQPPHVDVLHTQDIYRVVVVLKNAKAGGELYVPNADFQLGERVYFFNPKYQHQVLPVLEGVRYSLLFSFLTPKSLEQMEKSREMIEEVRKDVFAKLGVKKDEDRVHRKSPKKNRRAVSE
jgi:hypothetical protein